MPELKKKQSENQKSNTTWCKDFLSNVLINIFEDEK
jgi:hypothetical protein